MKTSVFFKKKIFNFSKVFPIQVFLKKNLILIFNVFNLNYL